MLGRQAGSSTGQGRRAVVLPGRSRATLIAIVFVLIAALPATEQANVRGEDRVKRNAALTASKDYKVWLQEKVRQVHA